MTIRVGKKYQHLLPQADCACCTPELQAVTSRINLDLSRRGFMAGMAASVASLGLPDFASAQSQPSPAATKQSVVFRNLRLFDGVSNTLRSGVSVLVEADKVADVVSGEIKPPEGARVIDCGGRTLMPGLIDCHWHTMLAGVPLTTLMTAEVGFIHLAASAEAERTLLRGFTTVRDMGGPAFALKKAIDTGMINGPRIYPSGATISQTSGHGDFRFTYETPRTGSSLSRSEVLGAAAIADSPHEIRRATREQLMAGATQIKITAGGGVASLYDPLDVTQFRPEEIRSAVEAAEDWGTYVAAHVYMPVGIKRCIEAGVKSIEHGQLIDVATAKIMADRGTWWSLQPFLVDEDANQYPEGSESQAKLLIVSAGTDVSFKLAKEHKIKTAWGTDILFDPKLAARQTAQLAKMVRWYSPVEVLKLATSGNAEILKMSGPRNPYASKLGVIEKGAYADMLLVDGDPIANISLIADPGKNFKVIMKAGRIHKNTL